MRCNSTIGAMWHNIGRYIDISFSVKPGWGQALEYLWRYALLHIDTLWSWACPGPRSRVFCSLSAYRFWLEAGLEALVIAKAFGLNSG
jgi:hypothetical protein